MGKKKQTNMPQGALPASRLEIEKLFVVLFVHLYLDEEFLPRMKKSKSTIRKVALKWRRGHLTPEQIPKELVAGSDSWQ